MEARIICGDLAGLRNQALGLVEAAGLAPDVRTVSWRGLAAGLPPLGMVAPLRFVAREVVAGPLPGVVVACGGQGSRVAAALRGPAVRAVAVQDPRMDLNKFDLVFAARHDAIAGANVFVTRTALHRATPARLAGEAMVWAPAFARVQRPLVAVLLGGSNGRYRFGVAEARDLAGQLAALIRQGAGVAITPSRRTAKPVVQVFKEVLGPLGAWIWAGGNPNPYFGMLGLADAVVVTADSVSMVSEAVATSVPVFLVRLPGKSARIGAFMDMMAADGRVRDFAGKLDLWDSAPMDDTPAAGAALRSLLGL
jgi:mitochondrial fission protein ELM1